jgi:hypothetical protein
MDMDALERTQPPARARPPSRRLRSCPQCRGGPSSRSCPQLSRIYSVKEQLNDQVEQGIVGEEMDVEGQQTEGDR